MFFPFFLHYLSIRVGFNISHIVTTKYVLEKYGTLVQQINTKRLIILINWDDTLLIVLDRWGLHFSDL